MGIESVRAANPSLEVRGIEEIAFSAYGRVLELPGLAGLVELAGRVTGVDPAANRYVASLPELEAHPCRGELARVFGFADIQVGYCNGPNSRLNGLEYHKSAEIDVAVTDLVLLLGLRRELGSDLTYDSGLLACFYLPAGSAVELLPEVLHYSPCRVAAGGFKSLVVLPRGTNSALSERELRARPEAGEGRLLFMRNKWLVAHPERAALLERGAFPGIRGANVEIKY